MEAFSHGKWTDNGSSIEREQYHRLPYQEAPILHQVNDTDKMSLYTRHKRSVRNKKRAQEPSALMRRFNDRSSETYLLVL